MKTISEKEELETRMERLRSELDSIAERKGQLAAEAAGLEASLPKLLYASKVAGEPAAGEAITNAQARLADIQALSVGFDWRREEVGNMLMALDVEMSGKRHAAAQKAIREAEAEINSMVDKFTGELLTARLTCEVIGARSAELAGLEVTLRETWGRGSDAQQPEVFPWNRWSSTLGRRVHAFFRHGTYTLNLDTSSGQERTLAKEMLVAAGVKLLDKQTIPQPDRVKANIARLEAGG